MGEKFGTSQTKKGRDRTRAAATLLATLLVVVLRSDWTFLLGVLYAGTLAALARALLASVAAGLVGGSFATGLVGGVPNTPSNGLDSVNFVLFLPLLPPLATGEGRVN